MSIRYTAGLAETGIDTSADGVGDSYDNALTETIIGLCKTEEIRPKAPWRSIEYVEFATASWVQLFNDRRQFTPIGDIPPVELEQMYDEEQANPAVMAGANQSSLRNSWGDSDCTATLLAGSKIIPRFGEPRSGNGP